MSALLSARAASALDDWKKLSDYFGLIDAVEREKKVLFGAFR